jgi:flagellar biogenesis protein FliO
MFGTSRKSSKQPNFKWWVLILAMGLGLMLLFFQGPLLLSSNESQTLATDTPESQPGTDGDLPAEDDALFLEDYDPAEDNIFVGQDTTADDTPAWQVTVSFIGKFILVIGLAYAVIAGLRWLQGKRDFARAHSATVRVLETTTLASGRNLHLIIAGNKVLLIGSTEHQVTLLSEIPEAAIPVPEDESTDFEDSLSEAESQVEPSPEWQSALDTLRAKVKWNRQVAGD